ncbi:putative nucleotidyltransferase substrate binding domain-containing protein [Thalassospira sp.]|uniref:putative nucleotidyltransferase substrate binding domain-containing protein n=1 Tax=Thalassospira sp. TaxID=1912094 RepID=UPI002736F2D4|nr:putative nucleotidyltransferase substrate binding domain-containing protein [Thalassospira sp.]MDP2698586.1 putative nucleotidyltransferase substrate binding domain-containing protein [Thalassospira sp.]
MTLELSDIRDFLKRHHPFGLLPDGALADLPSRLTARYFRKGSVILDVEQTCLHLHIIRSGAVETRDPSGNLLARLSEGECFGVRAMFRGGKAANRITAIEDCLVYQLPEQDFHALAGQYPQFSYFFELMGGARLRGGMQLIEERDDDQLKLMSLRVSDLIARAVVSLEATATIREAGQRMSSERVSCLLLMAGEKIVGIITDRDLRNRVVALGRDLNEPVSNIMTANPISIRPDAYAFDALLTMTRHNIRHLPVLDDGKPVGVVTTTNLLARQSLSAVYMAGNISKRDTAEGMAEVIAQVPELLSHLIEAGATSQNAGHIVTTLSDSTTARLLMLAEEKFGPPPVPYVWLAGGSQGRQEQTALSDQDNCLILDDAYDAAKHGDYFKAMADYVCDGLNVAGYVYCPGDMMAKTDEWRQPVRVWQQYFNKWIEQPEPKALMLCSVWFDLRPIHGSTEIFDELHRMIRTKANGNRIFLAYMVGNALTHHVPLGFFRNFVMIRGGDHHQTLDMKHNGVIPIVDIARIHALGNGIASVNTYERLHAAMQTSSISQQGARDLLDAYEFISITRLKHQTRQIREGQAPNNFLHPDSLSAFERSHLKDAFSVIKSMQNALETSFGKSGT